MLSALQKSDSDVQAMKKQAENLTVEYDRLLEEHSKLLVKHTHTHTCICWRHLCVGKTPVVTVSHQTLAEFYPEQGTILLL